MEWCQGVESAVSATVSTTIQVYTRKITREVDEITGTQNVMSGALTLQLESAPCLIIAPARLKTELRLNIACCVAFTESSAEVLRTHTNYLRTFAFRSGRGVFIFCKVRSNFAILSPQCSTQLKSHYHRFYGYRGNKPVMKYISIMKQMA